MRQWIGSHLKFANVVSLAALFVALGGTATAVTYVVSSNSQIGPGTVSGHKPPSGKHSNIIAGSVNGSDLASASVNAAKVAPNSLTGANIQESSLDSSVLQSRVSGSCSAGDAVASVAQNGTVTCVAPSLSAIEDTACSAGYSGTTHTYYIDGVAETVCRQVTMSPVVGNGILENNEQCDDGNAADGDGCSSTGTLEFKP